MAMVVIAIMIIVNPARCTVTPIMLPVSLPALQNGPANAQLGAALLLAAWCLQARHWIAATTFLWLAVCIKPLAIAALGLAWAVHPKFSWRLALGGPVTLALPFLLAPPQYAWGQYAAVWSNLHDCAVVTEHRFADLNGLLLNFGTPLTGNTPLAVHVPAGLAFLLLCRFGVRCEADPRRPLHWLAAATAFLILFNPMTEANSYVILAPAMALAATLEFTHGWLGNSFALAWRPAMTIGLVAIVAWQVLRRHEPDAPALQPTPRST
jgi:hypothetical protein